MLSATSLLQSDTNDITSIASYGSLICTMEEALLGFLCHEVMLRNSFSEQIAAESSVGRAHSWIVSGFCKGQWLPGGQTAVVTKSGPWEDNPQIPVQQGP